MRLASRFSAVVLVTTLVSTCLTTALSVSQEGSSFQTSKESICSLHTVKYDEAFDRKPKKRIKVINPLNQEVGPYVLVQLSYARPRARHEEEVFQVDYFVFSTLTNDVTALRYDSSKFEPICFDGSGLIVRSKEDGFLYVGKYGVSPAQRRVMVGEEIVDCLNQGEVCSVNPSRNRFLMLYQEKSQFKIKVLLETGEIIEIPALSGNAFWIDDSLFVYKSDVDPGGSEFNTVFVKVSIFNANNRSVTTLKLEQVQDILSSMNGEHGFYAAKFRQSIGRVLIENLNDGTAVYTAIGKQSVAAYFFLKIKDKDSFLIVDPYSLKSKFRLLSCQ